MKEIDTNVKEAEKEAKQTDVKAQKDKQAGWTKHHLLEIF